MMKCTQIGDNSFSEAIQDNISKHEKLWYEKDLWNEIKKMGRFYYSRHMNNLEIVFKIVGMEQIAKGRVYYRDPKWKFAKKG
jgi:hypothetical protein